MSMRRGRDFVILRPPPTKADWFNEYFGSRPIYLPFDPRDTINAATWIRRMVIRMPCPVGSRDSTLLFCVSESLEPFLASTVDTTLRELLLLHLPAADATCRSFHSFRIGYACALKAAGASVDEIQCLCRWKSAESVVIYARFNPEHYAQWTTRVMQQDTSSMTAVQVGTIIDSHERVAMLAAAANHES